MKRKRVLMATTYEPNDTTSFLRAWGPFSLMRDEVEMVRRPPDGNNAWYRDWHYWADIDVCYLHRPSNPSYNHLIHYAKLHKIPVWVDHDDDLLNITPDNPVYFNHAGGGPEYGEAIINTYKQADILTCSGELMYDDFLTIYGRSASNTFHITTALDDRLVSFKKPFTVNNRISWRGSKSHLIDLLYYANPIVEIMNSEKDKQWFFYGINPYWLDWSGEINLKWVDQLNLYPYLSAITHTNASIHMVPLFDTRFNRVKSNLSWLDATLAGSVLLGPDFEHFRLPGIRKYKGNSLSSFKNGLLDLIQMLGDEPQTLERMHNDSWEYIRDNLLQSKLNKIRSQILRNL